MNPTEFEARMTEIGLTAKKNAAGAVRMAFLRVAEGVATETPADVGTAISNWIPTINTPASGVREAFVPGKDGSTKDANAQEVITRAQEVVAAYQGDGQVLHLANNTRQIGFLNAGSSKQAPALFVEAAVARGIGSLRGVRIL